MLAVPSLNHSRPRSSPPVSYKIRPCAAQGTGFLVFSLTDAIVCEINKDVPDVTWPILSTIPWMAIVAAYLRIWTIIVPRSKSSDTSNYHR